MNIRKLTEADRPIITKMIAGDADHTARGMQADFFFAAHSMLYRYGSYTLLGRFQYLAMCFEDAAGVVFYVRLDVFQPVDPSQGYEAQGTVRVHIQFDETIPRRTALLLAEGFEVVKDRCRQAGATRMVFDSINGVLRSFCINRFHFAQVSGTADLELSLVPASTLESTPANKRSGSD